MPFISRSVKQSYAVIALSALCVFGARANQSTGWPTSDCEPSYRLNLVGNGCFTLSPEPDDPGYPMYKRGQSVIVGFEPDENYAFEKWTCDPPSHLASGNTSPVTGVFITSSTTLEAKTRVTCPSSLRVRWFNEAGDVPKPPGAEYSDLSTWNGLPCEWRLPLTQEDLDADFEITAVPNAGYYTEWHSPFYGTSAGYRIGNTIKLRSTCSSPYIEAQFTQYNPHTDIFFTVDVDPVSMADIWTAQPDGMDPPYGSGYGVYKPNEPLEFRSRGGGVYQAISMTIIPKPDQYVSHVTYAVAGGGSGYAFGSSARNSNEVNKIECVEHLVKALNYVAHSVPGIRLNIEVDGHGVVTSEDFACSWNPKARRVPG